MSYTRKYLRIKFLKMKSILLDLSKTCLIVCISITAYAQKSDDMQAGSVWNSNVKVDGKMTEWMDPLKASNKSTNLSYTLANDDKNLYLVILSTDVRNINKIMLGGISFTVNTEGKKRAKEGYTITYPVLSRGNPGQPGRAGGRGQSVGQFTQMSREKRDSMQRAQQKTRLTAAKDIKVHGFKNITDSLISIYNTYGVKAFAGIDEKGIYISEFAIPLESMQMSVDNPKEFSYNIKVNGIQLGSFGGGAPGGTRVAGGGGGGGRGVAGSGGGGGVGANQAGIDRLAMMSPTDFWGKYTLTRQ